MSVWQDGSGTTFFAMRKHMLTWDAHRKIWDRQPAPPAIQDNLAQQLAAIVTARTGQAVRERIHALTNQAPSFKSMASLLGKYVLVAVGPYAQTFWHHQAAARDEHRFAHATAVCFFCLESSLHCTCEHAVAAFMRHETHGPGLPLQASIAEHPERGWRRKQPPPNVLEDLADWAVVPGSALSKDRCDKGSSSALAENIVLADGMMSPLHEMLRAFGLAHCEPAFKEEGLGQSCQ